MNYDRLYLYIGLFSKYNWAFLIIGSNLQCFLVLRKQQAFYNFKNKFNSINLLTNFFWTDMNKPIWPAWLGWEQKDTFGLDFQI